MVPGRIRSLFQIFVLGVVLVSVPLIAGTVLAFVQIERLSEESRRLVVRSLEIGRETEKLIDHIQELNRTGRQYIVVGEREIYKLYAQKHFRLLDTVEWLELLVEQQEERRLLNEIRASSKSAFERIRAKEKSPDTEMSVEDLEELLLLSGNLRTLANSSIQKQLDLAVQRVEGARVVLYWIWGVSLVLVLVFVVVLVLSLAKPLRRIDFHMRKLGQGDLDSPIRIKGPADIAELGDRLDWLRVRLSEIDQVKERFFREMSHQLKTPLASIREGTGLLLEDPLTQTSPRAREILEILQENSVELQRTLDNMLKFSAWRADPGRLYREEFRAGKLLENIVQRFETSLRRYDISLHLDCPDSLIINMDKEKCRVIVDNLLSNAVKFSPEGGKIEIGARTAGSAFELTVADEGPGVPARDRERIFELYYLNDSHANGRGRGSGVGLSLVRAYVDVHGGKVYVKSAGKGAKFTVSIPV